MDILFSPGLFCLFNEEKGEPLSKQIPNIFHMENKFQQCLPIDLGWTAVNTPNTINKELSLPFNSYNYSEIEITACTSIDILWIEN